MYRLCVYNLILCLLCGVTCVPAFTCRGHLPPHTPLHQLRGCHGEQGNTTNQDLDPILWRKVRTQVIIKLGHPLLHVSAHYCVYHASTYVRTYVHLADTYIHNDIRLVIMYFMCVCVYFEYMYVHTVFTCIHTYVRTVHVCSLIMYIRVCM